MMTFVLAAAVLAGALFVAATLDRAAGAPPETVAPHLLPAGVFATDRPAPVGATDLRREPVPSRAGRNRAATACAADAATGVLA